MKPHKFQLELQKANPSKFLLPWRTGTGKTLAALLWGDQTKGNNLIIVPKHLKKQWERRVLENSSTIYKIVTKEQFRRNWGDLGGYNGVIVDEAHYVSGMKSQLSKNLIKYLKKYKINRVALLTATPYLSTPWNIYRLAQILGHKWNYWEFNQKFFFHIRMGTRMIPKVRDGIEDDIARLVKKISFSVVTLDDLIDDIPDQIFEQEYFSLTSSQKRAIKRMTKEETNPAVRYNYIHQIENGGLKGNEFKDNEFFEADKNLRVLEIIDENKKTAIFCNYNLQIDWLAKEIEKKGRKVYIINGTIKDKDSIIQEVESSEECVVLINARCSEGYQLPSISVIIFASLSFSYKDYTQSIGRFLRYDTIKKNIYIHLTNEGTIDEAVYKSIIKKENFDISIYNKN